MPPCSVGFGLAAATAACLYLDAKHAISYDVGLAKGAILGRQAMKQAEKLDRLNLFYNLEERALDPRQSDKIWLLYEARQWTYKAFYDTVLVVGQWLKNTHGVQKNEIVALDCMNHPNFLFIWWGAWSIGAKLAFINYNLTGRPLLHSIHKSYARLLLVDDKVRKCITDDVLEALRAPGFLEEGGTMSVIFFNDSLISELSDHEPVREPDAIRGGERLESLAMLIYTSGTTGNPKPSTLTWSREHSVGNFMPNWLQLTKDDRLYTCMPLYHSAAANLGCVTAMLGGCALILGHKFGSKTFWSDVRASQATVIHYVGETCRYLLATPPSPLDAENNVRVAFGNGLRPDIWDQFKERFSIETINEFYGATEGSASGWNRSLNSHTRGAVGRSGTLRRLLGKNIIVEHDYDTELPGRDQRTGMCRMIDTTKPGALPGEFISKLPEDPRERNTAFAGYYKDENANSAKILHDVLVKGDAYYRSGDILKVDHEGRMYFHDRIGDTFRWKSENVSTNEVAEALCLHPAVLEANVYGVQLPHHDGRVGCAAVILKTSNKQSIDEQTLGELAQHVMKTLPRYAIPQFLRFPIQMQTTGTNKQQKSLLRNQGVEAEKVASTGDRLFWLKDGTYAPYGEHQWQSIKTGKVRL